MMGAEGASAPAQQLMAEDISGEPEGAWGDDDDLGLDGDGDGDEFKDAEDDDGGEGDGWAAEDDDLELPADLEASLPGGETGGAGGEEDGYFAAPPGELLRRNSGQTTQPFLWIMSWR